MKYRVSIRSKIFGPSVMVLVAVTRRKNNPWGHLSLIDGDIIETRKPVKHLLGFDKSGTPYNPDEVIDFRRDA